MIKIKFEIQSKKFQIQWMIFEFQTTKFEVHQLDDLLLQLTVLSRSAIVV